MDFDLSPEQDEIIAAVQAICGRYGLDYWARCDQEEIFPEEFFQDMVRAGYTGMALPDQGRIVFAGQDITRMPAHARTRLGMARTFQNLALFSDMSVIDNVRVGAHVRLESGLLAAGGRTRSERDEEARLLRDAARLLDFVGLSPYAAQPAHGLAAQRSLLWARCRPSSDCILRQASCYSRHRAATQHRPQLGGIACAWHCLGTPSESWRPRRRCCAC